MINLKYRLLLILFSICFVHLAQDKKGFKVDYIDFDYNGDEIEITYMINNYKPKESYKISLDVYGNKDYDKPVRSITGDHQYVKGGGFNKISWDQKKDGYTFDEKIYFGLSISLDSKVHIPCVVSHVIKSVIFPGLGDYRIRNRKHYFLYGLVGYGAFGASYYFNKLANENYAAYESSFEVNESNDLFVAAKKQQNISRVFSLTAGLVWILDVTTLWSHVNKVKRDLNTDQLNSDKSRYYYNRSVREEESRSSPPKYINTKEEYEKEFDLGMEAFNNKNWSAALGFFENSKSLNPSKEILDKINKVVPTAKNEIAYNSAIKNGNTYFSNEEYSMALKKYKNAQSLKPNDTVAKEKIRKTNAKIKIDTDFKKAISLADNYFIKKDYQNALAEYRKAKKLKPLQSYSGKRIKEIETILVDNAFDKAMSEGDKYYRAKKYQKAKEQYNKAKGIKPSSTEPTSKINEIDNLLVDNAFDKAIAAGDIYLNLKQYDKAKVEYNKAKGIKPSSSTPKTKLDEADYRIAISNGDKYYNNSKYKNARTEYRKAQYIKPSSNEVKRKINEADYEIAISDGNRYFRAANYEMAKIEYEAAIKFMPQKRYPKVQLAKCNDAIKRGKAIIDEKFIEIYNENNLKIEIMISIGEGCNMKANMYSYRYDGMLSSTEKYINWKIDYFDCNNRKRTFGRGIPIGGHDLINEFGGTRTEDYIKEAFDDQFECKTLKKEVYDVKVSYQEERRDR